MAKKKESEAKTKMQRYYPWLLVAAGFVGLAAAFVLMLEKIAVLKDPSYVPTCNVNPIIACGSVIGTDQASAFGFPNPLIGIFAFGCVVTVGMTLLAARKISLASWYWRTFWAGTIFGVGFVHWLFFQSVYRIEALCPYCMIVWMVTIALFWYTTLWIIREGYLKLPKSWAKVNKVAQENHLGILISWYLIIIALILNHFWYFFGW